MTFNDAAVFILAITAGILSLTVSIFLGTVVLCFMRKAEPISELVKEQADLIQPANVR